MILVYRIPTPFNSDPALDQAGDKVPEISSDSPGRRSRRAAATATCSQCSTRVASRTRRASTAKTDSRRDSVQPVVHHEAWSCRAGSRRVATNARERSKLWDKAWSRTKRPPLWRAALRLRLVIRIDPARCRKIWPRRVMTSSRRQSLRARRTWQRTKLKTTPSS